MIRVALVWLCDRAGKRRGELTDERELMIELERDLTKLSREVDEWWSRQNQSS